MSVPESSLQKIKKLSKLNVIEDVCSGRTHGTEKNIQNNLVIDICEALGYERPQDFDFEHNVGPKSADLALMKDGEEQVIIEAKSLEKKLENFKSQGLEYARKEGILWAVLTNGIKTQLYRSTIPEVPDRKNEPIFESSLKEFPQNFGELYELIAKENIIEIEEKTEEKIDYIKKKITEEEFLEQLEESKNELYYDLRSQFESRFDSDDEFTEKVKEWADNNDFDMDWNWINRFKNDNSFQNFILKILEKEGFKSTKTAIKNSNGKYQTDEDYRNQVDDLLRSKSIPVDWIDKLCNEGAYAFVNRILFLRMYEDRLESSDSFLEEQWIDMLDKVDDSEGTLNLLNVAFSNIKKKFPKLYDSPLFDSIYIKNLKWDKKIVMDIVSRTLDHDFSSVNKDILGEVYQNHIPKEVRKALGQFYTRPSIVRYMLKRAEGKINSDNVFLDPGCGSGTFLIELYEMLKNNMLNSNWDEEAINQHILEECIYGIDIDSFAHQLTTMNLLLKDMNNPADHINIVSGNTLSPGLASFSSSTPEENSLSNTQTHISLGDIIRKGKVDGFDLVIGNPPHHIISKKNKMPRTGEDYKAVIDQEYSEIDEGRINIATLFIKRGIDLLNNDGGILAFVIPKPMTFADGYIKLRKYILENCKIIEITDIGKAWDEVGYEQVLIFLSRSSDDEEKKDNDVRIVSNLRDVDDLEYMQFGEHNIKQEKFYEFPNFPIYLSNPKYPDIEEIWENIWDNSLPLKDIDTEIFRGLGVQSETDMISDSRKGNKWTPILRGAHIGGSKNKATVDDQRWFVETEEVEYVDTSSDKISDKDKERLNNNKIICKDIVSSDVKIDAAYDDSYSDSSYNIPFYNYDTVTNIVNNDERFEDLYLLGILLSDLITVYLRDVVFNRSTLTMHLDEPYLNHLPIANLPKVSESDQVVDQNDIVHLVKSIITKRKEIEKQEYDLESTSQGFAKEVKKYNELKEQLNERIYKAYGVENEVDTFKSLLRM